MTTVLIVEKSGNVKELKVKKFAVEELYKKAGHSSATGFQLFHNWTVALDDTQYTISLYGKKEGKANAENKYEFPPPVDKILFFGNCVLVNSGGQQDLTVEEWDAIYESLYGGFDELGEEDTEEDEDDDDEDDGLPKTKEGYVKDDFIVEDEDEIEDDEEDSDEDDDDDDVEDGGKKKPKHKPTVKKGKVVKRKNKKMNISPQPVIDDIYLDCKSELSTESYLEE